MTILLSYPTSIAYDMKKRHTHIFCRKECYEKHNLKALYLYNFHISECMFLLSLSSSSLRLLNVHTRFISLFYEGKHLCDSPYAFPDDT